MGRPIALTERVKTSLGLVCLMATMLLLSSGINAVRAEETESEVSPALVEPQPLDVVPARKDGEIEMAPRAIDPAAEAARGPIVFNTRGYNYGPNRPTARPVAAPTPAPTPASIPPSE